MKNSNNVLIAIIAVVVIVVGGVLYWRGATPVAPVVNPVGNAPVPQNPAPTTKVNIAAVTTEKLPEGFPSDVPIEAGAKITQNFQGTNAAGQYQASREFVSKKSAVDNFKYYQTILKQNGWEVTNSIDDTARAQKIILAKKTGSDLNIRIYSVGTEVRVSINNITAKQ